MPSMRCLMTAGEALKRENIAGYNCSYVAVDRVHAFDEILYILMNGTGVGFLLNVSTYHNFLMSLMSFIKQIPPSRLQILNWDGQTLKDLVGMLYIELRYLVGTYQR